jgi:hypothetical protein
MSKGPDKGPGCVSNYCESSLSPMQFGSAQSHGSLELPISMLVSPAISPLRRSFIMPVILWFLGVPISLIIVAALFGMF